MKPPFENSPEFRRLLNGEETLDLARIALEIARDAYPMIDIEAYLLRLERFSERVRERCHTLEKPRLVLGQINWVLFVEEGFQGNVSQYDDPRNSYLNEVIDRKTGIPISLSVIYWHVASKVGLSVAGLNLPAHFMLNVSVTEPGQGAIIVDPFHSGALLDREGCRKQIARQVGRNVAIDDASFEPCTLNQVVSRMLRNLTSLYVNSHEYTAAIPVLRRLAALNPTNFDEQRDLGLLLLRLDRPAEAIVHLQKYIEARPDRPDAPDIQAILRVAQREFALRN